MVVTISIWTTFMKECKIHKYNREVFPSQVISHSPQLRSLHDSENEFHNSILRCDELFYDWIRKLRVLLFGEKFMTLLDLSESIALEDGGYRYPGLFEACMCEDKPCLSNEEQQVVLCIEQLHVLRFSFGFEFA